MGAARAGRTVSPQRGQGIDRRASPRAAALDAGITPDAILVSEAGAARPDIERLAKRSAKPVVPGREGIPRHRGCGDPQAIAAEIAIPRTAARPDQDGVFLEGVQDPGNVGAIIRERGGVGVSTVYLDRACADAWSPKVLRAAAGGHFALALVQAAEPPTRRWSAPWRMAERSLWRRSSRNPVAGYSGRREAA